MIIELLKWLFLTPYNEMTILHGITFAVLFIGISFPLFLLFTWDR